MLGQDLMDRLDGVLMRFRKEPIAVIADIQQMFFSVFVRQNLTEITFISSGIETMTQRKNI